MTVAAPLSSWSLSATAPLSLLLSATATFALLLAAVAGTQWLYALAVRPAAMKNARPRRWPRGTLPFLRNTLHAIAHAHRLHHWLEEQCEYFGGEPFWASLVGAPPVVVLSQPEQYEDVLRTHFETFDKGPIVTDGLRDLLGDGIFAADGAKWFHQRKTASNLFSLNTLRDSMAESVQRHTLVLNAILAHAKASSEPVDVFQLLNKFTLEAFGEIAFGVTLGGLDTGVEHPFQAAFDCAQRAIGRRFTRPIWFWKLQRFFNVGLERELQQSIRVIDDMVLGIVATTLANRQQLHQQVASLNATPASPSLSPAAVVATTTKAKKKDIVSLFLDSSNADAACVFEPKFLRDIVVNFLIAGRDTTAQTLSWFFYCISQHPRVAAKIHAEIASILPELLTGTLATPSMEQAQQLVYLEAALRETLRLYPAVPGNMKGANKDVLLRDGTLVRKGEAVILSSYATGRMTNVWGPDAKEFKPERWLDATTGKLTSVSSFKFIAFHAGPRMCLGMNLAMMEMQIVASTVLSQFRLELAAGQDVTYEFSLTHPIKGGLAMHVLSATTAV